jgi:hypothetical protein
MSNSQRKQQEQLLSKFILFLKDVAILPWNKRAKPNSCPLKNYATNRSEMQWGTEALAEAAFALTALRPNVSIDLGQHRLRYLAMRLFEEQIINGNEHQNAGFDIESLYDVLDISVVPGQLEAMIAELESDIQEYVVVVPIEGIQTHLDKIQVRNATIYPKASPEIAELFGELELQGQGTSFYKFAEEELRHVLCYAIFNITGDQEYAKLKAVETAEEAVKFLNLFVSSAAHSPSFAIIQPSTMILYKSLKTGFWGYSHSRTGILPYQVDRGKQDLMTWYERQWKKLSGGAMQERVQRAVNWYSRAVDAESPEESFVNLSVALESLLIDSSENNDQTTTGSINQKLRERVAFLLEDNLDKRRKLSKLTASLYGLRSGIVHSGKLIDQRDLIRMNNIVRGIIQVFIDKQFGDWQSFLTWIEEMRFK